MLVVSPQLVQLRLHFAEGSNLNSSLEDDVNGPCPAGTLSSSHRRDTGQILSDGSALMSTLFDWKVED